MLSSNKAKALEPIQLRWFGRKTPIFVALCGVAVCLLSAAAFPRSNENKAYMIGRILLAVTAKGCNLIAFDAIYVLTVELYPTTVRNIAMGTSSGLARVGSFSSTYIVWLYQINHFLPFVIMGAFALTAAILSRLLPETNQQPTRETMSNSSTSSGMLAVEDDPMAVSLANVKNKEKESEEGKNGDIFNGSDGTQLI